MGSKPFEKILIANRGEIAVRVIRTCRDMGISAAAVYSAADKSALHVQLADEAYCVGPPPSSESYLRIDRIIDRALKSGADAVHPGYGFLAENERFAQACEDAGLVFIGPSPKSIALMGSKIASRNAVEAAGVNTVPGTGALGSCVEALDAAEKIGFPVLIKASAGGGGKGMRVVYDRSHFRTAYDSAMGEAESSFGDSTVYMEKYLESPRHIEIQLLADHYGNAVHLGERECSIQRRHQKLVEESPSPVVDENFRRDLGAAALAVAESAGYYNAGTVEFLVDSAGPGKEHRFYFLEMNTRLQVEHPVTEMVTGLDLVREQILVAAGEKLTYSQDQIHFQGAAIECRIYAEDPGLNFLPSPGPLSMLREPAGPGVRNDSGVYEGFVIPVDYDSLISKLIVYGNDRETAIARMRRALREYKVGGVKTTIPFFEALLVDSNFISGVFDTHFIDNRQFSREELCAHENGPGVVAIAAALDVLTEKKRELNRPALTRSAWKEHGRKYWS